MKGQRAYVVTGVTAGKNAPPVCTTFTAVGGVMSKIAPSEAVEMLTPAPLVATTTKK